MIEYIHLFITIITSVVFILISILIGEDAGDTLYRLIFIMIAAYAVGLVLRRIMRGAVKPPEADITASAEDSILTIADDYSAMSSPSALVDDDEYDY